MAGLRPLMVSLQLFATRRGAADAGDVFSDLVAKAVLAEQLDFDAVWLAEHHDTDWNICSDPLTLLATLAAETSRVRLGAAVVNLPLQHPARVAEQAAMVNALSGGRLELGLGKGFSAADYFRFGLDPADADRLFQDKHERLCELLRSDPDTVNMATWLASSGNLRAVAVAIEHGHGLLLAATGQKLAAITDHVAERDPSTRLALVRAVHTGDGSAAAERELRPYLAWYMSEMSKLQPDVASPSIEKVLNTFCLLGTARECVDGINELCRTHRLSEVICVPGIGGMNLTVTGRVLKDLSTATRGL